ncbi:MAG: hypothetical protein KDI63_14090 [Gammaproteobacteria bacterium]|nr:hypothetical protein [Gammaproteobacteria bacterium]
MNSVPQRQLSGLRAQDLTFLFGSVATISNREDRKLFDQIRFQPSRLFDN